jgi:hypothetical protein
MFAKLLERLGTDAALEESYLAAFRAVRGDSGAGPKR